jgi:hypothetical protein
MISWQESVTYDPIGDCSRSNRNPEFWKRQMKGTSGTTQKSQPRRTNQDLTSSAHRIPSGCRIVKEEERQRRLELIRERNRRMYER